MAQSNTQLTLEGLFKETYAKEIIDLYDFSAHLTKKIPFVQKDMQPGNRYHQPVDIQLEAGLTYAASGILPDYNTGTYLPPKAGQMLDAFIEPAQLHGRFQIAYEASARSQNAKAAFKEAAAQVLSRGLASGSKRNELMLLHGRQGYGVVAANPANGASRVVQITDASWSSGIWAGMVGSTLRFFNGAGVAVTVGSSAPGQNDAPVITGVNSAAKQLTVSFPDVADQSANLANTNIFFETGSPTTEMVGLGVIASTNIASAPLFGINPATYDLWQGNQLPNIGAPSFAMVLNGHAEIATFGIMGYGVCVVSPKTQASLVTDQAAMRMYDASFSESKLVNGTKALTFITQTGPVEILSHAFQKDGQAYSFITEDLVRVGATDIKYVDRGGKEFLILESYESPSVEARLISSQSLFCGRIRSTAIYTGITVS